ncbi:hypothetical protein DPMN_039063 [Dreissena polymorpha]|uniref:Uncharacterized protein n=1 Tax=Dreissena polymorpha TaxID=45954 RepID=A0A9D4MI86_DREPO|nr:hypothetical protein DPMN_039063 [Dreissena polymorpha]
MQAQLEREGTGRNRRRTFVNLDKQLDELCDQYDQGVRADEGFLGIIGEPYAFA